MKTLQVSGSRLTKNGEQLISNVKKDGKIYVVRLTPYDTRRGYFGKSYLEPLNVLDNQLAEIKYLEVEKDEEIKVFYLDFSRNPKKPEIKSQIIKA